MPIYNIECTACHKRQKDVITHDYLDCYQEVPELRCTKCGEPVIRVMSDPPARMARLWGQWDRPKRHGKKGGEPY